MYSRGRLVHGAELNLSCPANRCSGRGGSFDHARDQRRLKARAMCSVRNEASSEWRANFTPPKFSTLLGNEGRKYHQSSKFHVAQRQSGDRRPTGEPNSFRGRDYLDQHTISPTTVFNKVVLVRSRTNAGRKPAADSIVLAYRTNGKVAPQGSREFIFARARYTDILADAANLMITVLDPSVSMPQPLSPTWLSMKAQVIHACQELSCIWRIVDNYSNDENCSAPCIAWRRSYQVCLISQHPFSEYTTLRDSG
jgi:hypothetical protein